MRKLRYSVAVSLDGFIAGPNGEVDWIIIDPAIDFQSFFQQFDTAVMGRSSYEVTSNLGGMMSGMSVIVCSRSMNPDDHADITITRDAEATVRELKPTEGKDIWLFGGGNLFRNLLEAQLVDSIELAVIPVMLGNGVPLITEGPLVPQLQLTESRALETGTLMLSYDIHYEPS